MCLVHTQMHMYMLGAFGYSDSCNDIGPSLRLQVVSSAPGALPWPAAGTKTAAAAAGGGDAVVQLWESVLPLLLHKHTWVRKAAARVVGLALGHPATSGGLLGPSLSDDIDPVLDDVDGEQADRSMRGRTGMTVSKAPHLAFLLYMQLACPGADEATCRQAVKCLVPVAMQLHKEHAQVAAAAAAAAVETSLGNGAAQQQQAVEDASEDDQGLDKEVREEEEGQEGEEGSDVEMEEGEGEEAPEDNDAATAANGRDGDGGREEQLLDIDGGDVEEADDDDEEEEGGGGLLLPVGTRALSFPALIRRMARLADNARYAYVQQRLAALRWMAAIATKLGGEWRVGTCGIS